MRTCSGLTRRAQLLLRRDPAPAPVAQVKPLVAGRPLLGDGLGVQVCRGWRLDQVDHTTCGSAVLLALAAWADPAELARLDGDVAGGFGGRYDARQLQVHRETNRLWPRALGTTPWGMVAWLRRNVPAAGRYRVRLVDDESAADVAAALAAVEAALDAGRPVPLLVGTFVPRHYVLALGRHGDGWRVYEPTTGSVRAVDVTLVGARRLRPVLGFDRVHAVVLPS